MITDFDHRNSVMQDALNLYSSSWSQQALLYLTILVISTFSALVGDMKLHLPMSTVAVYTVAVTMLLLVVVPIAQAGVSRLLRSISIFEDSYSGGRQFFELIDETSLKQQSANLAPMMFQDAAAARRFVDKMKQSRAYWLLEIDPKSELDNKAPVRLLESQLEVAELGLAALMKQTNSKVQYPGSHILIPLRCGGTVVGVLEIARDRVDLQSPAFKRSEISLVLALIDWATQEIARAHAPADLSPDYLSETRSHTPLESNFGFLGGLTSKDPNHSKER